MSTLVIAEIGVNHGGSFPVALQLINEAKLAGADVAKFQMYKPELLTGDADKLDILLKRLLFAPQVYKELANYCKEVNIGFACTGFDADSLDWLLDNTDMEFVKIPSGQSENVELLKLADISGKMVIQSIKEGSAIYKNNIMWKCLWVVPEYPTPPEHAKLYEINGFSGLSDHSGDIFMPLAAVALGAEIIECHITMSKAQEGPDHKASLTPGQFKQMVDGIRAIEKALQ